MALKGWITGGVLVAIGLTFSSCIQHSSAQKQQEYSLNSEPATALVSLPDIPLDSLRDSSSTHLHFQSRGGAQIASYATQAEACLDTFCAFFSLNPKPVSSIIHLYSSVEAKGILTRNTRVAHVDDDKHIHRIIHPAFEDHEDEILATCLLREYLGKPEHHMLERGLAVHFTQNWRKKGYRYWAARLIHSDNGMPISELLDNELIENESDLVTTCMAGVWVDFLLEELGASSFIEQYTTFSPNERQAQNLEKAFSIWVTSNLPKVLSASKNTIPEGLKGFNFTHEGYNIDNGYSGNMATCALDTLCQTGANAIALVPYSYMRNPKAPSFLPFMRKHPGTETDEGVIHCMYQANQRKMFCMLKPQVWLGGGSWPGDVQMQSDKDWGAFFDYYYRWVRHYALLADMYEAEAFCVGVEFAKATQERPEDWRRLIGKMRGIYPGIITYAANWGEEFQALEFADALDVVGLNCYYPLGKRDSMSQEQLQAAFEDRLELINKQSEKWDRQVWLTELGYPSLAMPWKRPHAEPKDMPSSPEHQARCYAATLNAIEAVGRPVSQFWWKWSTDPKSVRLHDKEFIPMSKPAQEVLREMWKR